MRIHIPRYISTDLDPEVDTLLKKFMISDDTYRGLKKSLNDAFNKGLSRATHDKASVKMFPTFVRGLPDGTEQGNFLALDLGGTNFRVLLITIQGIEVTMKNKIYPIATELMTGPGTQLFDYIIACIYKFTVEHGLTSGHLPLGFTFSFPCRQTSLRQGFLVQWTKGFSCAGVEGEDVVRMLQDASQRLGKMDVECVALLNDTVGCLMSCAFLDHNAQIGVILGTGTNACYLENLDKVGTWTGDQHEPKKVVINTEWGAFGDHGELDHVRTEIDKDIDKASLNPGRQIYEKMISGMYMGEIVRCIVVECVKAGLMFDGALPKEMEKSGRFYTKYISEVEKDEDNDSFANTSGILEELGVDTFSMEDCRHMKHICTVVSSRAAYLASVGIATLLDRINLPHVVVAVDGSLYRYHPHFHNLMMDKTKILVKKGLSFNMMLSEDGSGKGAALVAAVAARMEREKLQKKAPAVAAKPPAAAAKPPAK